MSFALLFVGAVVAVFVTVAHLFVAQAVAGPVALECAGGASGVVAAAGRVLRVIVTVAAGFVGPIGTVTNTVADLVQKEIESTELIMNNTRLYLGATPLLSERQMYTFSRTLSHAWTNAT